MYPDELCKAICRGLKKQMEYDAKNLACLGTMDTIELEGAIKDMVEMADEYMNEPKLFHDVNEHEELIRDRKQQRDLR